MSSYLSERHSRSMNTLSIQRPRPSIEILTPVAASVPVKAALVNWLSWSVLKISGRPKRAKASSSADTQNEVSIVFDRRQASTARLPQSMIPPRYRKALADRHIGDIGRPHLIRPIDHHMAQKIREDLVPRRRLCGSGLWSQRRDAHLAHQPLHALAIDATPFAIEHRRHPPRAQERPSREQLVDPLHQLNVVVIGRPRRPIYARSRNAQQLALPADR